MIAVPSQMRVLVTGGRDYADRAAVFRALDTLANTHFDLTQDWDIVVIHGACCFKDRPLELRGADRWTHEYALEREFPVIAVPARWASQGKPAGPIRNEFMITEFRPTNAIVFPGGVGTHNMVKLLHKYNVIPWHPETQAQPIARRTVGR